jgi:hypothetical protein
MESGQVGGRFLAPLGVGDGVEEDLEGDCRAGQVEFGLPTRPGQAPTRRRSNR